MNQQQIIKRLKKLKALKERGDGGEALNAERLFAELCNKYHISPDVFDDEVKQVKHAVVSGSHEYAEILSQIVWKRVGREPDRLRMLSPDKCKRMKKYERNLLDEAYGVKGWDMLITCTDAEFVQVMFEWEILKQNYDERKEAFMFAFLDKNDLLLEPTADAEKLRANSEAHARLAREASFYSAFMQKADVRKALKE